MAKSTAAYAFLEGGGEMGSLMLNHNWSQTSVGSPELWPVTLRIFLNFLLNSKFPMFLFWGPEHVCFYNDPYKIILGKDGKHPSILGRPGKKAWPEIWDSIQPTINGILSGEKATWYEDRLVPIYKDDHLEDAYWTFSFSPVMDEYATPVGVFVICTETTQAVRSSKKLKDNEARLELISNTVPAMIFYLDREQRYLSYNERFMEWFDVNESEAIGKTVRAFLGEAAYVIVEPHLSIAYDGLDEQYEMFAPSRMGNKRWLNIVYTPHKNEDGTVAGVIVHATDITQSKEIEIALRNSEARFRSLIEEAPVATCLFVGSEMIIEVANDLMIEYIGEGRSVIGKPLAHSLPEIQDRPFHDILSKVFTTGETFQAIAAPAKLEAGGLSHKMYFDYTFKPLKNDAGEVYGILTMGLDVTKRVIAEKLLEQKEQNLRNTILQAPFAICIFRGPDFIIEIANKNMFEFWGKGASKVLGKPLFEAVPEAKDYGYEQILTNILQAGKRFAANELPITLTRAGMDQTVYIDFTYDPIRELDGTISAIMATAIDVTAQREARQKIEDVVASRTHELAATNKSLQDANFELQRSNHNLEEFAHAASHDLKEPIRKIRYYTEKLKAQLQEKLSAEHAAIFSRISDSGERMGMLIDDLLLYSQVSLRPHEKNRVNLSVSVATVLEDLELDIKQKNATINIGELPFVKGYRRQLQQLFQNLVSNALKYSKADVPPEINISAQLTVKNEINYHVITLADNGIGFDQKYERQIFEMFARLHGKNEYGGTGIGLAIAKRIMENHDGFIEVESETNVGSIFKVYLPLE